MTIFQFSFVFGFFFPAIRDYSDILNNLYDSFSQNINILELFPHVLSFIGNGIKFLITYCFSFQWIQDLTYLPILVPQIKNEILKEHFFLQPPESTFLSFLEIPSYTTNKFFLGFLNSFFLCLPLSLGHFISARRFFVENFKSGMYAISGLLCGQIILLSCILFGGRFFVIPWYNFQPLYYILIWFLIINTIYKMSVDLSIPTNKSSFIKIFLLNFFLTWTEQSCVFQYFGNLTLGAEPTIIENFSSATQLDSILTHITYILGISIGSLFFTSIFLFISHKIVDFFRNTNKDFTKRFINKYLLIVMVTFSCTSLSFYSFDYLFLSNLGVVSQDRILKNTIFIPTKFKDNEANLLNNVKLFSLGDQGAGSKLDTEVSPFDKGRYLMFNANDSFEQLNYQVERLVTARNTQKVRQIKRIGQYSLFTKASNILNELKKTKLLKTKKVKQFKQVRENENTIKISKAKKKEVRRNFDQKVKLAIPTKRFLPVKKINDFFENLIIDNFSARFTSYDESRPPYIEKKFRYLYSANPIYKLLLSTDIDFFLLRQPRSFTLNPQQEKKLFLKRLILANYYDSLRYYNDVPKHEKFTYFFAGSKSYADRVYNHQFKGTLKIVRRLFSLTLNKNSSKFEEMPNPKSYTSQKVLHFDLPQDENTLKKSKFILKFDQPLYTKPNTELLKSDSTTNPRHSIFHEELPIDKTFLSKQDENKTNLDFIDLANPIPFYVGWDEQLRKLVITNRLAPKYLTNYSMKFPKKFSKTAYPSLNTLLEKNRIIEFTTWPISQEIKLKFKNKTLIPYNTLSTLKESIENKNNPEFNKDLNKKFELLDRMGEGASFKSSFGMPTKIPRNIQKNIGKAETLLPLNDIVPYTRGGFVWPGHSNLHFNFEKLKSTGKPNK